MITKLQKLEERFNYITEQLMLPEVISDTKNYKNLCKEQKNLAPIVENYNIYKKLDATIKENEELLKSETDIELKEMLNEEILNSKKKIEEISEQTKILLLPKDENDDGNVIMEIRGGAGGDEASLFAGNLYRMYKMYADRQGFKTELIDINETLAGGIKEVSFIISGQGTYKKLKFESGVHRVQRVPETESQGRVHTSTATVAVLPEEPEVEVEILDKDIRVDNYCASGAGGQHVNKTESAVRITHFPTGIVVTCQDERSKIKNMEKAMKVLKAKIYDLKKQEAEAEYAKNRKDQVGTGDRSERIRTYNYPQGRVTDHRIGLTMYNLTDFMNGDIDEMVEALNLDYQQKLLEHQTEQ